MEVLTLQHYVPASDEASNDKGNVAFLHHDIPHQNGSLLDKDFMNPSQAGLTFEGDNLREYFGLAMAICAVGFLRNACPGYEAFSNRFLKDGAQERAGQGAVLSFERLVPSTVVSDKVKGQGDQQSLILQTIARLQLELSELKRLRSEDGKANEKVVSIFASKEQDWKLERRKLQEEHNKLYLELQRAFLQQEALRSQMEPLRSLRKQPCPECEHRKGLFVELKDRLGEQEFLIMATMEEVQIERQEKNAIAEKLAAVELSLSQSQKQLSMDAEHHALELAMYEDLVKQLESSAKLAENEKSQILLELTAAQASFSALTNEKNHCKESNSVMSRGINQLQASMQGKDTIISAMFKKANADAQDRRELENELAFTRDKVDHAEREKQKWRRLVQVNARSSSHNETFKPRSSFESRRLLVPIGDLQALLEAEIKSLQTAFEEQVQMLQRRLSMYQARVADLEEDILLSLTNSKHAAKCSDHVSTILHAENVDNQCIVALYECIEAEFASKQFQLSVAKTLIKQFMDSEVDREQEVERWNKLYFESKATLGFGKGTDCTGTTVPPRSPKLQEWSKLDKSRLTYKLEKRHWQEIDAFERQMRARDERMEAFRKQLLHMADEVQTAHRQLEILNQSLATSYDDRTRLEEILKQKEEELMACQRNALVTNTSCGYENSHNSKIFHLQQKVAALQTLLTEREMEYELSLAKASAQAECELEDADLKLAVTEAQLVQTHIIREGEKKGKEKFILELERERLALEHCLNFGFRNDEWKKFQAALPRLPTGICRAHAQISFDADVENEHVKELVDYSTRYSHCNPEVTSMEDSGDINTSEKFL
ncbi:hypothetical protein L7F22_011316 [Adiantum nelumboides]|nr:hypothetical protein [Adiantum nelumboides]